MVWWRTCDVSFADELPVRRKVVFPKQCGHTFVVFLKIVSIGVGKGDVKPLCEGAMNQYLCTKVTESWILFVLRLGYSWVPFEHLWAPSWHRQVFNSSSNIDACASRPAARRTIAPWGS